MTQIAFASAFDHLPIREDLVPFARLSVGLHLEQMWCIALAYLHTPSYDTVTFLPSPKKRPRRTVARIATLGDSFLVCSVKQLCRTHSLLYTSSSGSRICQESTTGWNSRSG